MGTEYRKQKMSGKKNRRKITILWVGEGENTLRGIIERGGKRLIRDKMH